MMTIPPQKKTIELETVLVVSKSEIFAPPPSRNRTLPQKKVIRDRRP